METNMLRKLALGLFAAVALGATALSPTAASAGWHGGWHGGGFHRGFGFGPRFFVGGPAYYGGGCVVRRLVFTPWGPRYRLVNRCY
jgi:hypothetical protein